MPHPALANATDGSLHYVHAACAKNAWGLEGYQETASAAAHPCCLCGEPAHVGALVGHAGAGMPCQTGPAHPARHGRASS